MELRNLLYICGFFLIFSCTKTVSKISETNTPEYFETQDNKETDLLDNDNFRDNIKNHLTENTILIAFLEKQDKKTSDLSLISRNSGNFTDYTPLLDFKNLKTLYIDNKLITDISGITVLSQHEKLSELILWSEKVTDISPLSALVNLRFLSIDVDNTYTNASELLPLVNLDSLVFRPASSETILNISKLTWLKSLYLSLDYKGLDISPIQNLNNLEHLTIWALSINYEKIELDISWMNKLLNLQKIEFSGLKITDISPLLKLPKLKEIDVMFSEISEENIALLRKIGTVVYTHADADH